MISNETEASASEILVLLGEELITSCCSGIIERAFQCLGGDLQEFLSSLDGVYDVLKLQEEDVTDTGFVCAGEGELIFTSERPVIAWLLLGSLKALTKILYGIDVSITIEPVEGDFKRYRYFFTQKHEEESSEEEEDEELIASKAIASTVADLKMSPATFCKAFPWHFIMNENLELVQMGSCFKRRNVISFILFCFHRQRIYQTLQKFTSISWTSGNHIFSIQKTNGLVIKV